MDVTENLTWSATGFYNPSKHFATVIQRPGWVKGTYASVSQLGVKVFLNPSKGNQAHKGWTIFFHASGFSTAS